MEELLLPIRTLFASSEPGIEPLRRSLDTIGANVILTSALISQMDDYLSLPGLYDVLCLRASDWMNFESKVRERYAKKVRLIVLGPDQTNLLDSLPFVAEIHVSTRSEYEDEAIVSITEIFRLLSEGRELSQCDGNSDLLSIKTNSRDIRWTARPEQKPGNKGEADSLRTSQPGRRGISIGTANIMGDFIQVQGDLVQTPKSKSKATGHTSGQTLPKWTETVVESELPDLIIFCEMQINESQEISFLYRLFSPIPSLNLNYREFQSPSAKVSPQVFVQQIFSYLNDNPAVDSLAFANRLKGIGADLYNRLFPNTLKRLYWDKLRNIIHSILIVTEEPWIPWELLLPNNPSDLNSEELFLCEKFALARWLGDYAPSIELRLSPLAMIIGATDLDYVLEEAKALDDLLGDVHRIPPTISAINNLFKNGGYASLHFACHGEHAPNNPDLSLIYLEEGQEFSPIDINGKNLMFGKDKPFVFLNTCQTGQSGYALTGMGGWAEAFIRRAGCTGFLGSLFEARDDTAFLFSKTLFQELLDGKSIGDATQLARLKIKKTGDPTWLSYTLYANPKAQLTGHRY